MNCTLKKLFTLTILAASSLCAATLSEPETEAGVTVSSIDTTTIWKSFYSSIELEIQGRTEEAVSGYRSIVTNPDATSYQKFVVAKNLARLKYEDDAKKIFRAIAANWDEKTRDRVGAAEELGKLGAWKEAQALVRDIGADKLIQLMHFFSPKR